MYKWIAGEMISGKRAESLLTILLRLLKVKRLDLRGEIAFINFIPATMLPLYGRIFLSSLK